MGKRKTSKCLSTGHSPNKNVKKKQVTSSEVIETRAVDTTSEVIEMEKEVLQEEALGTKEEEDDDGDNALVASDIQLAAGGDVIGRCRVLAADKCPRIPLCRFLPYAKVRGLQKDVTSLKIAFSSENYMPEKGTFVVSTHLCNGEETNVTDDIRSSWDPMWLEVDIEFEKEVSSKKELKFMSKKMFYVWEGNHRTKAWMEVITELFKEDKGRHVRVMCTLIDPKKVPEIALLACLQRMNVLNEHAVIKPLLRDVLINTSNICESDAKQYIDSLKAEETELVKGGKNKETWFPFSRGYLARLVYQVEYNKDVASALETIERTIPEAQRLDEIRKEKSKIQKRISDRIGKVLLCLHPKLGDQWKKTLFDLQFEGKDSYITLEKLRMLATAEIQVDKRVRFLKLLEAPRITREQYLIPTREVDFKGWLMREIFLDKVESMASSLLESLLESMEEPPIMPNDPTLRKYLDGVKLEARKHMFQILRSKDAKGDIKSIKGSSLHGDSKESKSMDLEKAGQRVIFRYFKYLVSRKLLLEIPSICKIWCKVGDSPLCMYPITMHGLSQWEVENCPWWIDFPLGYRLEEEIQLYDLHATKRATESTHEKQKEPTKRGSRRDTHSSSIENNEKDKTYEESLQKTQEENTYGDTSLAKEVVMYIYGGSSKIEPHKVAGVSSNFGCCVGDYIEMGADFEKGQRNENYGKLHEFFCLHAGTDHEYHHGGKIVKWAAGLVCIDFPTGMLGLNVGEDVPNWDVLTEDHVRFGISIAAASLDDIGWLVMISPLQGPCLSWIEKYVYCQGLKVARRVVIGNKIPYGGYIQMESTYNVRCSILLFAHKMDYSPSLFIENSKALFKAHSLQNEEDFWTHYMPENKKIQNARSSCLIRGAAQKSVGFMGCILRACCAPGGLVIEMGCGLAPLSHAAMILGYTCFAFDNDATIIKDVVEPAMVSREKRPSGSKVIEHRGGAEEFVVKPLRNPFMEDNYMLPCYAELEAQAMAEHESCDSDFEVIPRSKRKKCDLIDDECEESR